LRRRCKAVTFGLQMRIREEFRPEEERTPGLLQDLVATMEVIACRDVRAASLVHFTHNSAAFHARCFGLYHGNHSGLFRFVYLHFHQLMHVLACHRRTKQPPEENSFPSLLTLSSRTALCSRRRRLPRRAVMAGICS
jgi:hypothetical protein